VFERVAKSAKLVLETCLGDLSIYLELRQYPVEYYTTCEYTCKFFTLDPRTMVGQKSQIPMLIALRKPEHAKTDPNLGQYTCMYRTLLG
jgi:hypothetical protein